MNGLLTWQDCQQEDIIGEWDESTLSHLIEDAVFSQVPFHFAILLTTCRKKENSLRLQFSWKKKIQWLRWRINTVQNYFKMNTKDDFFLQCCSVLIQRLFKIISQVHLSHFSMYVYWICSALVCMIGGIFYFILQAVMYVVQLIAIRLN